MGRGGVGAPPPQSGWVGAGHPPSGVISPPTRAPCLLQLAYLITTLFELPLCPVLLLPGERQLFDLGQPLLALRLKVACGGRGGEGGG